MLKRLSIILLVFMAVLSAASVAGAQDVTAIAYGDVVEGEITDSAFEVAYTFEAAAGDVVLVEIRRLNSDSNLYGSEILVTDADNNLIANTANSFSSGTAIAVFEAAADATYTILATRDGGRSGSDTGTYVLKLLKLEELSSSETNGQIGSAVGDAYFAVRAEGAFTLNYTWNGGNYVPAIDIQPFNEEGFPDNDQSAGFSGFITAASISVLNEDPRLYLVAVSGDAIDYMFDDEIEASFTVSLGE